MKKSTLLKNWRNHSPSEIVGMFTDHYSNYRSRASSLSVFKTQLRKSSDPPTEEYLSQLMLSKKVYDRINTEYLEKKQKEGLNVRYVHGVNEALEHCLNLIHSKDIDKLWPAVIFCSGFRPIEILTANFRCLVGPMNHSDYYITVSGLAKKRKMQLDIEKTHPLLCKSDLWLDAVDIIRGQLNLRGSNIDIMQRYGHKFLKWLRTELYFIDNVTNTLLRRLYGVYAYECFKYDYGENVDRLTFMQLALNHETIGNSAVYNLIDFDKKKIIDIFNR